MEQQAALRGDGAAWSASWMPPAGCCGAAALGSLRDREAGGAASEFVSGKSFAYA